MPCGVWSFCGKRLTAWPRVCEGVRRERVLVCVIRLNSLLFFFSFFLSRFDACRVSSVFACAADLCARGMVRCVNHVARYRSVSAVSVLRDVAAVGVFVVKVCPFVCCRVYAFVSCVALCSLFFVRERGHERPIVRGCRDARAAFLVGLCACVCVSACVM